MPAKTYKETWRFKKGQNTELDSIYFISGIGINTHLDLPGDWWEPFEDNPMSDAATITRTVTIEIKVTYHD